MRGWEKVTRGLFRRCVWISMAVIRHTTWARGWLGVPLMQAAHSIFAYYNIVETDPDGYVSVEAQPGSGAHSRSSNDNWIQYAEVESGVHEGNYFYDFAEAMQPTLTPTATATETATATPTYTVTPIPTDTPTASPTAMVAGRTVSVPLIIKRGSLPEVD